MAEASQTVTGARGKPIVGVTGPDRGGLAAWWMTWLALRRAGARAVRITPARPIDPASVDGLVLGGGADVAFWTRPELPEDEPRPVPLVRRALSILLAPLVIVLRLLFSRFVQPSDPEDRARDDLELGLLAHASANDLPVLGICRGAQLMNLAEGGSLMWHVRTFYTERPELRTALPRREVRIDEGSLLARTLGVQRAMVNSLHDHAVDQPGRHLCVVAREPDGVTQAIEHAHRRYWLGVQWHPEYLPQLRTQQRLFHALVAHARRDVEAHRPSGEASRELAARP